MKKLLCILAIAVLAGCADSPEDVIAEKVIARDLVEVKVLYKKSPKWFKIGFQDTATKEIYEWSQDWCGGHDKYTEGSIHSLIKVTSFVKHRDPSFDFVRTRFTICL